MGELISRSAAREFVRKAARYVVVIPETGRGYDGAVLIDEIMHGFNKLPAIDAVPVVRCNRCKYYEQDTGFCQYFGSGNQWDGFCNKGARMDGDADESE